MKKEKYTPQEYLMHIKDAIVKIESYTDGVTKEEFFKNSMMRDAVIRNFEIIGEASNNVLVTAPDFFQKHKNLSKILIKAYDLRNAVIHGYIEVDYDIIWNTINHDLPTFSEKVDEISLSITSSTVKPELEL